MGKQFQSVMINYKFPKLLMYCFHAVYTVPLDLVYMYQIYEWVTMLYIIHCQKNLSIAEILFYLENEKALSSIKIIKNEKRMQIIFYSCMVIRLGLKCFQMVPLFAN